MSLLIILLAAIPLILFSNKKTSLLKSAPAKIARSITPTLAPLTTSNVDQILSQNDQQLQQTLSQVDADLQAAAQVNASQDSTAGL
ncbi:MAG TPA: hypothetical protein VN711_04765 [Candidatus Saccharimonadales bacterium]|nr:hypothetical protein [Candidatus Saccharimonadales bacterium]